MSGPCIVRVTTGAQRSYRVVQGRTENTDFLSLVICHVNRAIGVLVGDRFAARWRLRGKYTAFRWTSEWFGQHRQTSAISELYLESIFLLGNMSMVKKCIIRKYRLYPAFSDHNRQISAILSKYLLWSANFGYCRQMATPKPLVFVVSHQLSM